MSDPIVDEYTRWLASWSPSQRTVKARRTLAANRLEAWGLAGFTSEVIQEWLGTSDFSAWSRATYYSHLVDFCSWLVATGRLVTSPMDEVRKPKRPKSVPRPLTEAEVALVLAAATGDVRDWIRLALLSGLRAHEIAKIKGDDVSEASIYVDGKGGVRATIPTHSEVWAMARRIDSRGAWWPGRVDGHVSANVISQKVGALFREIGLPGSIHRCRHTYGTRLLRAGVNIRTVQKLMRHSSLATTETYLDVTGQEMSDAIGLLSA